MRRRLSLQQWRGTALCSRVLGQSEWAWAKAVDEVVGAWHRRVHDRLRSGVASAYNLHLSWAASADRPRWLDGDGHQARHQPTDGVFSSPLNSK